MANHLRTELVRADLVLAAMEMAIGQRRPGDVIHHSDQGCQGGFNQLSQHLCDPTAAGRQRFRPASSS